MLILADYQRIFEEYFLNYKSRNAYYVQIKAHACRILRNKGYKVEEIAKIMGFKQHSGVVHLLNTYKDFTSISDNDFWKRVYYKEYPNYNKQKKLIWQQVK